jgi:hypothetical protein
MPKKRAPKPDQTPQWRVGQKVVAAGWNTQYPGIVEAVGRRWLKVRFLSGVVEAWSDFDHLEFDKAHPEVAERKTGTLKLVDANYFAKVTKIRYVLANLSKRWYFSKEDLENLKTVCTYLENIEDMVDFG